MTVLGGILTETKIVVGENGVGNEWGGGGRKRWGIYRELMSERE